MWCSKCGSVSHNAFDCSKPQVAGLVPPAAPVRDKTALERHDADAGEVSKPTAVWTDPHTGRTHEGLSGPLPTRKNFPFLRDSTRREMDERTEALRRRECVVVGELAARPAAEQARAEVKREAEKAKPTAPRKPAKKIEGGLF